MGSGNGKNIKINLKVWRQDGPTAEGRFENHDLENVSTDMSFLEMMDTLNEKIIHEGGIPVEFDHDCREGICGMCSMVINGNPHGPDRSTTTCQLHMRTFADGDTVVVEPFRAKAFPVVKDLAVDRSSFDKIQQAGGYVSVSTGNAPDAHATPVNKESADLSFEAAVCIGCGACVAACPNASASLFTAAKIAQYSLLPQGQAERELRAQNMVETMDSQGFGGCTNTGACSRACPKEIKLENIAKMNKEYIRAKVASRK
ncbi:MAG: succinate dehydrogenase/fumarate reductase iron-sulfur subunit [Bdellovibrionales bacterium]